MAIPAEIRDTIVDIKAYADGRIYEAYKWLRANEPFARIEAEGYDPFHVVTRHADILEISRQNDPFTNGPQPILFARSDIEWQARQAGGMTVKSLIQMDGDEHKAYRGLTSSWFLPGNIKKIEGRIRALARRSVDRMAEAGGRCDFVNEIALHYPLLVIMEILGLPEKDEPMMLELTQGLFGAADPDEVEDGGVPRDRDRGALFAMMAYFNKLTEDRRANPTDDLTSVIANALIDDEPLNPLATMGYYIIVATAGHDTTSSSTGGAMWALAQRPDQLALVKSDPTLIGPMIDEAVRWTSPVKHFMRTATADTEINGHKIAKGDWLMLCYASANRDETVFDDPDSFRVDRKPNRHIAFGYGGHVCLGQHLAKMEMRILFEELLPRLESVELDGDPAMSAATFVNGPLRLPIRYTMS
jgi:cytochrome P450